MVERPYHHGNLRDVLVAEGVKLIEEHGLNALTLREIGIRAGVSRTAAYRHFADKAALLSAISEAAFTEFATRLEAARESSERNCAARLEALGVAYLRFATERKAYYEVMFGLGCEKTQQPTGRSPAGERAFAALRDTILDGQATGEIGPGDPDIMAGTVWAMSHGVVTLQAAMGLEQAESRAAFMQAAGKIIYRGMSTNAG